MGNRRYCPNASMISLTRTTLFGCPRSRRGRQRDQKHADALRLRDHVRQLEAGGELPAPRALRRRARAAVGTVQDGRIYIERINAPFMFNLKGSGSEFGAGLKCAIERGGTYVKLMPPGEDLLSRKQEHTS
ncbi:hypothetical protein ACVMGC_002918 [Bradyrhizobium barranii subsp. barranii]